MPPRTYRRPINPGEVAAYGRLLSGSRETIKAGDTCSLSGKQVVVLAVDGSLAKVMFMANGQRTATCHIDLLEAARG